jgi:hypothetical protein
VRLYLYDARHPLIVQALEVALPRAQTRPATSERSVPEVALPRAPTQPTTSEVCAPEAEPPRAPERPATSTVSASESARPAGGSTRRRRSRRERKGKEVVLDLPLHMRADWRHSAGEDPRHVARDGTEALRDGGRGQSRPTD